MYRLIMLNEETHVPIHPARPFVRLTHARVIAEANDAIGRPLHMEYICNGCTDECGLEVDDSEPEWLPLTSIDRDLLTDEKCFACLAKDGDMSESQVGWTNTRYRAHQNLEAK
jgi:hypothetical protein